MNIIQFLLYILQLLYIKKEISGKDIPFQNIKFFYFL